VPTAHPDHGGTVPKDCEATRAGAGGGAQVLDHQDDRQQQGRGLDKPGGSGSPDGGRRGAPWSAAGKGLTALVFAVTTTSDGVTCDARVFGDAGPIPALRPAAGGFDAVVSFDVGGDVAKWFRQAELAR
jgi:hypothetical protein